MVHRVLKIGRWVVDFLFAIESYDKEGILSCLYEINAPYNVVERAEDIIDDNRYNSGFTYGNPRLRRAVVVVGPTTSARQFLNTFSHEVDHLSDIIAKSLGIKDDTEGTSYLTGDTTMALAEVVCALGCSHCRQVK